MNFLYLIVHPDILQVCREGITKMLPNGIESTNGHLSDLVVYEAVINETLRHYSPVAIFGRYCVREYSVGIERSLRIPKGTTIVLNNYIRSHRKISDLHHLNSTILVEWVFLKLTSNQSYFTACPANGQPE